jgi:hypothetical protein
MRRPLRGLLIGPSVVPVAYWLGVTAHALAGQGVRLDIVHALRELLVIVAFGLPLAWGAALLWGAPMLYLLHRFGWLRASTVIAVGALGGTIVAWCLALVQQGSLFRVVMPWPAGAALGALAGLTCWWLGQGPAVKSPGSASSPGAPKG